MAFPTTCVTIKVMFEFTRRAEIFCYMCIKDFKIRKYVASRLRSLESMIEDENTNREDSGIGGVSTSWLTMA